MDIAEFHRVFAWVVVGLNGVAGVWAVVAQKVFRFRHPILWKLTIGAQISLFVQAITGAILFQDAAAKVDELHPFYGFVSLAFVAILYGYREYLGTRMYLFYGVGGLFLMGMSLRAMNNL